MDHLQEVGHWKPEPQLTLLDLQSTGKITWMKFKPDLAPQLIKEIYVCLNVLLYCTEDERTVF